MLLNLGFEEETHAYMHWILHATRLTRPKLQVVYSVFGHARMTRKSFPGYPVMRYPNLFVLAIEPTVNSSWTFTEKFSMQSLPMRALVKAFDKETKRFFIGLGEVICERWNQPDHWNLGDPFSTCSPHTFKSYGMGRS